MSLRGIRHLSWSPLAAVLLIGAGCATSSARAKAESSSIEPDPDGEIARLRHENSKLRAELKSAQERARFADRDAGADASERLPAGRSLPVVKLTPKGGEAGVRHTESIRLSPLPNSDGYASDPTTGLGTDWSVADALDADQADQIEDADAAGDGGAATYATADPLPAAMSDPSEAGNSPRSFRLVGSHLVAETKRKRAKRSSGGRRNNSRSKHGDAVIAKYEAAMNTYRDGRFGDAEQAFDEILRAYPEHEYADNALYWKGEAAYDQSHYSDALAAFTEVVERYGGGNKAADALLKIGLCYGRLGDGANARDVLTQLISAYPDAVATGIARSKLDEFPQDNSP